VRQRLFPRYEHVVAVATSVYPKVDGRVEQSKAGYQKFQSAVTFSYDRVTQEHEDLFIYLCCAPAGATFFNSDGSRKFPNPGGDAIGFYMERGTGFELAQLEPELLPGDEDSPEYEQAVLDYVGRAEAFLDDHLAMILDILRTPFYS